MRRGPVPMVLHGLALTTVRRAPQRPIFFAADCVAIIPEFRGDGRCSWGSSTCETFLPPLISQAISVEN